MRNRGFTLIELMVAMSLLLVLGLMLVGILRHSLELWHESENTREIYANIRTITATMQDDLEALYAENDSSGEILFLLDQDTYGRQRLRFIRKIKAENQHPHPAECRHKPL